MESVVYDQDLCQKMMLYINEKSGMQYTLEIYPSDLIRQVKEKLYELSKIHPSYQTLKFNNEELEDSKALSFYSIKPHQGLDLYIIEDCLKNMKISDPSETDNLITLNIMKPNKNTLVLRCSRSDTVKILKNKIFEIENIQDFKQRLIFGTKQLEDEKIVDDYGVNNNDTVNLTVLKNFENDGHVIIKTSLGQVLSLRNIQGLTIRMLKINIEKVLLIPKTSQQLFLNEIELRNFKNLTDYGVQNEDILFLLAEPKNDIINFFVKLPSNILLSLNCPGSTKISKIFKTIEEIEGIPSEKQFFYTKELLDKEYEIEDYPINDGDTIDLAVKINYDPLAENNIKIFVKTLAGQTFDIYLNSLSKIIEINIALEEAEGIPSNQQKIIFAGRVLELWKTLADYNIQKESILHLLLKLRREVTGPVLVLLPEIIFNEVNLIEQLDLGSNCPPWADVGYGLIINGICSNSLCLAFNQLVFKTLGYGQFDLRNILNNLSICPACDQKFECRNMIFIRSLWYYKAVLEDGTKVTTKDNPSFTQKNKYATYLKGDDNKYQSIRVFVKDHIE